MNINVIIRNVACAILLSGLCAGARSFALEISLVGAGGGGGGAGANRIGFVDLERIYQIYPQTQNAKEDYAKQLARKRQQLSEKESELNNIKGRIAVLEATLKDMGAAEQPAADPAAADPADPEAQPATPAAAPGAQSIVAMKNDLQQKQLEYEDLRKQAAADLATFETQQNQLILGRIYEALRDLAAEEQITLVVDKSAILFGAANVDLTEKLQVKVRGY